MANEGNVEQAIKSALRITTMSLREAIEQGVLVVNEPLYHPAGVLHTLSVPGSLVFVVNKPPLVDPLGVTPLIEDDWLKSQLGISDPDKDYWGNQTYFFEWLRGKLETGDQLTTLYQVVYSAGRKYIFSSLEQIAADMDFQSLSYEDLEHCTTYGHALLKNIESYRRFEQQFRKEYLVKIGNHDMDFPDLYIFMLTKLSRYPYLCLYDNMTAIVANQFAVKEINRRIKESPEVEGVLNYQCLTEPATRKAMATSKQFREEAMRLFGTLDEAFEKVWGTLRPFAGAYLRQYLKDDDAKQEASSGTVSGMAEWAKRISGVTQAGLTGELWQSLNKDAQRAVDAWRKREERRHNHHQFGGLGISDGEETGMLAIELGKKAIDEYKVQEHNSDLAEHEDYGLHGLARQKLNLDLNKLNCKEQRLLQDVRQGLEEGYEFDSRTGMSFKQYWGKDYPRKIKEWGRLKPKLRR